MQMFLSLQPKDFGKKIFLNMKMSFQENNSTWHRFCSGEENAFANPTGV